jgi:hypothetical protein
MKNKNILTVFGFIFCLFLASSAMAVESSVELQASGSKSPLQRATTEYRMLAPLGNLIGTNGVLDIANGGLSTYLNTMFRVGIIVATALAIIMITMGGLKYASTDAINGKSEGKTMIQQALLGLVLALMSVLLLQQINPALLKSDLGLQDIKINSKINTTSVPLRNDGGGTTGGGGGTTSGDGGVTTENPATGDGEPRESNSGPVPEPPLPTSVGPATEGPNPLLPPITLRTRDGVIMFA